MLLTALLSLGLAAGPIAATAATHAQAASDALTLRARLVDEHGAPLRVELIRLGVCEWTGASSRTRGHERRADSSGVVAFELPAARESNPSTLELSFSLVRAVDGETLSAVRVVPLDKDRGQHDFGDCVLAPPEADVALRRASDAELEREFVRRADLRSRNSAHEREVQTCLAEMARRGGEYWIQRLESELRATQALRATEQRVINGQNELVVLTALRRAQRAPEPAQLVLGPSTPRSCAASALPTISFAVRNVDPQFDFEFSNYDFQRVRATLIDSAGDLVARKSAPDNSNGGGAASSWQLSPGASSESQLPEGWLSVDLAAQFGPLAPGEYRVVLDYSPTNEIAFARSTRGWILISSEPFSLRVK